MPPFPLPARRDARTGAVTVSRQTYLDLNRLKNILCGADKHSPLPMDFAGRKRYGESVAEMATAKCSVHCAVTSAAVW